MSKLHYACNKNKLDPELRRVFFVSEKSEKTRLFHTRKTSLYQIKFMLFVLMNIVGFSHYDIMGILGYTTHLIDPDFVKKHIIKRKKRATMLDIGAWNGGVTEVFRNSVADITCLEPSKAFQKILRKKGYTVIETNDEKVYDIVTIFNVLDICADPESIVINAKKNLAHDGIMIVSLPFPIWTRSWDLRNIKKTNHLGQPKEKSFEMGVSEFYDTFLRKHGLVVTGFTRLPYLVSKPEWRDVCVYDNGFFVCRRA